MHRPSWRWWAAAAWLLSACGKPPLQHNAYVESWPEVHATEGCFDTPRAPLADRLVVVSHPFDGAGREGHDFEVLRLTPVGELHPTNRHFTMGRAYEGAIRFTPDGSLGLVVQDDGTLGLFRLDERGVPTVIDPAFGAGAFYAKDAHFDVAHRRVWIVDGNWPENGGGVYTSEIDCRTGQLGPPVLITPSKLADTLIQRGRDRALLVATQASDGLGLGDAHFFDMVDGDITSTAPLLDELAIRSSAALVDDRWLLVADNSAFSGKPNRVAVGRVGQLGVQRVATFEIEDPFAIAASPFGNAAVVSSGIRDRIVHLRLRDGVWEDAGTAAHARLPGNMATIRTGPLRGTVLAAENLGVHLLRFTPEGEVLDLGTFDIGDDENAVIGTIGVQP